MTPSPDPLPSGRRLLWIFVVANRRAVVRAVLMMAMAGVAIVSTFVVLEALSAPWARSLGLRPTLAGDWTGELDAGTGSRQPVFFAIRGYVPKRGRPLIEGRARLCDRSGSIRDYEIAGGPDTWRGTRFHVSLSGAVEHDSQVGPGELQGEWEGDAIRATGVLVTRGRAATAAASTSSRPEAPPQVHFVLRRGSEADFLAACRIPARRD
jgi:hypothetical protein